MSSTSPNKSMEKRKDLRFKTQFGTLVSAGAAEGAGMLVDISYSGARLEEVSIKPGLGVSVRLYVFVQPVLPFELVGHVVRVTEDGFAMQYDVSDPDVRRLVDDVSAIVGSAQGEDS